MCRKWDRAVEHTRDAGTEKILGRRIPSDKCRSCSAGITHYRINLFFQVILQALELIFLLLLRQQLCLKLLQGIYYTTTHGTTQCLQNKTISCRRDWNSGLLKPQSPVHEPLLKRLAQYFVSILAIKSKPDT